MSKKIFSHLQSLFGVTKSELIAVIIILAGLIAGLIIKNVLNVNHDKNLKAEILYQALDSIAEAERTTFIGTDKNGQPDSALSAGDTIIEKTYYPKDKKKEAPTSKININTASLTELTRLPGIGPATAKMIVEYRKTDRFTNIEDIKKVKNIGQKKFEKLKNFIIVK
ncbi:MAG: comEA [Ignavibacteria bacterium]|nr:comEA [Ignavibacteria bacterium]